MKNGLTLPNCQWRVFTPQEETAILELQPAAVLVLGYPASSVLAEKISQEARLWEQLGRPQFTLRPYAENILDKNPGEWAETCFRLMAQYEQAHVTVDGLVPANELNVEQGFENWAYQSDWLKRFANVFRVLAPNVRLHLPALSPHGNYLDGHIQYVLAGVAHCFDVIDVHGYSLMDLTDVPGLALLYGKPVHVTEYNRINPVDCIDYLSQFKACEASFYFILSGEVGGGEDQRQHWLMGSPYYDAFKAAGKGIVLPEPLTPVESQSDASDVEDGGENNMDEATRNQIWNDWLKYPAFIKFRADHPELGDALSLEKPYGIWTVQHFGGGIAYCKTGDWENIQIATSKEELPSPL